MNTNFQSLSKNLFFSVNICGLLCNLFVGWIAFGLQDQVLSFFCLVLAVVAIVGLIIAYYHKVSLAIHLLLNAYTAVFLVASFTPVVNYGLLLIYPILISFACLYFKNKLIQNIYISISVIAIVVTLINYHFAFWGELVPMHLLASLVIGMGLILAFVLTFKIHTRKLEQSMAMKAKSERSIKEKNEALQDYIKTNLQLENFAHLASHDLKTPIQNISNFSQLLDRRLSGKLNVKDKEILDMIREESYRMSGMMADLLKLSQLSKKKLSYHKINGHKFINELVENEFQLDKGFIAINSFPLEIEVAEPHFHILFYNLLENAIKFCGSNDDPKIIIYGRRTKEHYYFEVKDNGIGIDDKYKKSVFLIFNQLNPSLNSEGTGIGLSMCREIVQRHNGSIWIEDNKEGGSIVKFKISRNLQLEQHNEGVEFDAKLASMLTA